MRFRSSCKTAAKLVGILTALILLGVSCGDSSDNSDPDRLDKSLTCVDYLSGNYIPIPGPSRIGSDYSRQQSIISDCKEAVATAEPERAPEPNASPSAPPPSASTTPRVSITTHPPDLSDLDVWWGLHGQTFIYLATLNETLLNGLNSSSNSAGYQLACENSVALDSIPPGPTMDAMIDSAPRYLSQALSAWYAAYTIMMPSCLNGTFANTSYIYLLEDHMQDAFDALE